MRRCWLLLLVCSCTLDEWPGPAAKPVGSTNIGAIAGLSVGRQNACVTTAAGALYCWGDNSAGQLGADPMTVAWSDLGRRNPQVTGAVTPSVDDNGTICVLDGSGAVQCLGSAQALGDGSTTSRATVGPVALSSVTAIFGSDGFCAVSGGTVSCWGSTSPYAPTYMPRVPAAVAGPTGVTDVALGGDHGCAIATGGQVWCWGSDTYGQLGDGQCAMPIPGVAVQAGSLTATGLGLANDSTCTIAGGALTCFGLAPGVGAACGMTQMPFTAVSGVQRLVGGDAFFCALDGQGAIACWGDNQEGELGAGTPGNPTPVPQAVTGIGTVKLIGAGGAQACAVTMDDKVYCWGQDNGVVRAPTPISFD